MTLFLDANIIIYRVETVEPFNQQVVAGREFGVPGVPGVPGTPYLIQPR